MLGAEMKENFRLTAAAVASSSSSSSSATVAARMTGSNAPSTIDGSMILQGLMGDADLYWSVAAVWAGVTVDRAVDVLNKNAYTRRRGEMR